MDPEGIHDTEACIYLGSEAAEIGLVDELSGPELLDHPVCGRVGLPKQTRPHNNKQQSTYYLSLELPKQTN